ncbi:MULTISPECIES: TetR/AcrR family transcriptional regulator [unclassified Streptomyces]|uniref:TetR/AcrR family transcriptional regulator n=1 Tax=Streptomyces TaxID=1883 RepID=UPI000FD8880F|nr:MULTISPECIES: TetR/AcrR family transcriptional regulator [unclassified Streptomyces]UQA32451.1 TetR/AcrR family transcriptional regulator [Streptomyces sp. HNA39]
MAPPGGRGARVQEAVHAAVRDLLGEVGRDALTVPLVAARAGVTQSTVYRRWGDLRELLSDIAVEHLRPDADPADPGSLRADLDAWAEQFLDEIASPAGRAYIRDALLGDPDGDNAGRCSAYAAQQIEAILNRAARRGEPVPDTETLIDRVVAPVMYRILFRPGGLDAAYVQGGDPRPRRAVTSQSSATAPAAATALAQR